MKKLLFFVVFACSLRAQTFSGQPGYTLPQTQVTQLWYGSGAPSNLPYPIQPGDFYTDTTNHNLYYCAAPVTAHINPASGGASGCATVTSGQWTLVGGQTSGLSTPFTVGGVSVTTTGAQLNYLATGFAVNQCGTTNTCSPTLVSATSKIVVGHTATLNGASPSIATVTGMPAFTSGSSYVCTGTVESASASTVVLAVNYVSATSVTFTAGNGATGVVSYICIGN